MSPNRVEELKQMRSTFYKLVVAIDKMLNIADREERGEEISGSEVNEVIGEFYVATLEMNKVINV